MFESNEIHGAVIIDASVHRPLAGDKVFKSYEARFSLGILGSNVVIRGSRWGAFSSAILIAELS